MARLWFVLLAWSASAMAQDTSVTSAPPASPPSAGAKISYGVETAYRTGHSDRGFLISDRPVFQNVVWLSVGGTESYLWSNIPLAHATDGSRSQIVEAELAHKFEWKTLSIGPAARAYFYQDRQDRASRSNSHHGKGRRTRPHARVFENPPADGRASGSLEAWLSLTSDLGPFTLFTNHSVDLRDYRGGYFGEAGVEVGRKVSSRVEIRGSFGAGWANSKFNDYWASVRKSAFNRASAEGWLTVHATSRLFLAPHVEFSSIVDRDVRRGDLFNPTYTLFRLTAGVELP